MLVLERHRHLLHLLSQQGSVRTVEVAKKLGVTEETVRRDFEKLESEGELLRSHGGAVSIETSRKDFTITERSKQNAAEKKRIARTALRHIKQGETIFLDASTTAYQLALMLPDQPLTVITNSLQTALSLSEKPAIRNVVLGGTLNPSSLSCTGWGAEQGLDIHRIDAAFISCRGLDPQNGLSEASEEQARMKSRVIQRAGMTILLADHSKTGLASSYFFSNNSDVDLWITDATPENHVLESLTSQGIRIEIAR